MRKTLAALTSALSVSALTAAVSAQTPEPSGSNLAGEVVAVVIIIVVGVFIVYAGYKVVKKWTGGSG